MRHPSRTPSEQRFFAQVRALEEELFPHALHEQDKTRMKSDSYSWHYRPSHHIATGLITEADVELLVQPGRRLLSVGADPAYLERLLTHLGVPIENIVIADSIPSFLEHEDALERVRFDMLRTWPEIGEFDRIILPESLCIALGDSIKDIGGVNHDLSVSDTLEATLLAGVLREALLRLVPDGEIRSNGPQSHPNVVNTARAQLEEEEMSHELLYRRYFLSVKKSI